MRATTAWGERACRGPRAGRRWTRSCRTLLVSGVASGLVVGRRRVAGEGEEHVVERRLAQRDALGWQVGSIEVAHDLEHAAPAVRRVDVDHVVLVVDLDGADAGERRGHLTGGGDVAHLDV